MKGYVAFVVSRYGGNKPYVIWEDGAKKFWGDKYNEVVLEQTAKKAKKKTTTKASTSSANETKKQQDNEETNIDK